MAYPTQPIMTDTLPLINRVLRDLPCPLVGSVCYDGAKHTKVCTPKAYAAFSDLYTLVRPTHVLEIGTHAGGSALMTLSLTDARVLSVDIGHTWITPERSFAQWDLPSHEGGLYQVERVLRKAFGEARFGVLVGDSTAATTRRAIQACHEVDPFDCAFIDGDHAYDYVLSDIRFARSLGIRDLIVDDLNSADGSDVLRAVREEGLTIVKEWPRVHSGGCSFGLVRAG